jgi:paraquat-inducible protein A
MSGVVFLYTSGSWPLALIVLIASVMIPLGKLVALGLSPDHRARAARSSSSVERTRSTRMVEFIGRWSMLELFVDPSPLLYPAQPVMFVEPGPGVLFFAAGVVLTMIAAESFDPR